jgi:hypothetical protein
MELLNLLNPVQMDASARPQCLLGTRQEVLSFITGWLTTPTAGQNVLWLYGLAGSGKSTISTTVAEYFRDLGRLGAFIFFDRNNPANSDPNAVIRTLAHWLASFDSHIRSVICAAIESDNKIASAPLQRQFAKLLLDPLESIATLPTQGPVVIVIDGLDECGDPMSRRSLLRLLSDLSKLPATFRFLITSREEHDINASIAMWPNVIRHELSITEDSNTIDVSMFLCSEMGTIRDRHGLAHDWPGKAKIHDLVKSSAGLFIWASLAANLITEAYNPKEQLEVLLQGGSHGTAEAVLDTLYATALHTAGKWDNDGFVTDFQSILGAVLAGQIPLSDSIIDHILNLDKHISSNVMLSRLQCLLIWKPGHPVQVLHASFADYLTNPARSGKEPWFINMHLAHDTLAHGCLQLMKAGLHFNICGLETSHLPNKDVPGLSQCIQKAIPPHLAYACLFWADHFHATHGSDILKANLQDFIYNHLLYWIEALSLLDHVSVASPALLKTAQWSIVSSTLLHYFQWKTNDLYASQMIQILT